MLSRSVIAASVHSVFRSRLFLQTACLLLALSTRAQVPPQQHEKNLKDAQSAMNALNAKMGEAGIDQATVSNITTILNCLPVDDIKGIKYRQPSALAITEALDRLITARTPESRERAQYDSGGALATGLVFAARYVGSFYPEQKKSFMDAAVAIMMKGHPLSGNKQPVTEDYMRGMVDQSMQYMVQPQMFQSMLGGGIAASSRTLSVAAAKEANNPRFKEGDELDPNLVTSLVNPRPGYEKTTINIVEIESNVPASSLPPGFKDPSTDRYTFDGLNAIVMSLSIEERKAKGLFPAQLTDDALRKQKIIILPEKLANDIVVEAQFFSEAELGKLKKAACALTANANVSATEVSGMIDTLHSGATKQDVNAIQAKLLNYLKVSLDYQLAATQAQRSN
jgi:hypothetical protein